MPWQRAQNLNKLNGEVPWKVDMTGKQTLKGNAGTFTDDPNIPQNIPNCEARNYVYRPSGIALQTSSFSGSGSQLGKSPGSFLYYAVRGQRTTFPILEGLELGYRYLLSCSSSSLLLVSKVPMMVEWKCNKHLLKRPCASYCRKLKNFNLHFDIWI